MRVEFNWTANEKRAKCVELFDAIVAKIMDDHGYALGSRERASVEEMVAGTTRHRKWLKAVYNGDQSQHIEATYRAGIPVLLREQVPGIEGFADELIYESWISAFGRATVQARAEGVPGLSDSSTGLIFNVPEDLEGAWEDDREAASYYPEETGARLDKLLSNLAVLYCAVENYQQKQVLA